MRKWVFIGLVLAMIPSLCFAQNRGPLPNVYASHVSVGNTLTTVTLPYNSRDLRIRNDDSADTVCVSPNGSTIQYSDNSKTCETTTDSYVFMLGAGGQIDLDDFITSSVTLLTASNGGVSASPVSVISTY